MRAVLPVSSRAKVEEKLRICHDYRLLKEKNAVLQRFLSIADVS